MNHMGQGDAIADKVTCCQAWCASVSVGGRIEKLLKVGHWPLYMCYYMGECTSIGMTKHIHMHVYTHVNTCNNFCLYFIWIMVHFTVLPLSVYLSF